MAATGIWVGVAGVPMLVMIAALTALAGAGVLQLAGRQLTGQTSISFGPFLAIGSVGYVRVSTTLAVLLSGRSITSDRTYHWVAAGTSPTAAFRRSPVAEVLQWSPVPR